MFIVIKDSVIVHLMLIVIAKVSHIYMTEQNSKTVALHYESRMSLAWELTILQIVI